MRTKFMRIRPERTARTSCCSSISTLNMAFVRASTTLPSTSISSFFGIASFPWRGTNSCILCTLTCKDAHYLAALRQRAKQQCSHRSYPAFHSARCCPVFEFKLSHCVARCLLIYIQKVQNGSSCYSCSQLRIIAYIPIKVERQLAISTKFSSPLLKRQNISVAFGNCHCVLEVSAIGPAGGDDGPVVLQNLRILRAHDHHRLDGDHHAWLEPEHVPWIA